MTALVRSGGECGRLLCVLVNLEDACPIATVALEVPSSSEILRPACAEVFERWISVGAEMYERSGLPSERARD